MSDSCHSGLSKPVIVGFVFSLFFVSQGTGADIGGTIPAPPKPFDSFDVVSYTATRLSDIAGKTPLAKKAGTRKVGSSPMQEESEQRWIVRSIADPDTTYAVRQTTQASGEISLCAYTPNRVLATLLPGKDYAAFAADMSAKGFTVVRELMRDSDDNPVYIVESQESETDIFEAMSMSIQATGFCDKVVPDYVYDLATVPNDALYSEQWALAGTEAPLAWETRTDASSILVAVLDSGINNEHVDLLGNLWLNENETPGDGIDNDGNGVVDDVFGVASSKGVLSGYTMDEIGHGSHCAGIIGAQGNNRKFVAGVAWKARMMALKFMRANGNGTTIDAVACLDYADRAGVNIVNCSFGILGSFDDCLYEQMKKMSRRGVIFVCAAGNAKNGARPQDNDEKPFYPANWNEQLDTVVSVAATDPEDNLAMFSFYGGQRVDIAAPGVDIYSTVLGSTALDYMSGTSMAAPHVTGALALLWAHYPDESATQIIERLYAAAEPIPALSGKVRTGARLSMARFFGIPTPGEIYVSQGSDADAVVVYWAGSKNATHYRVWRAESENGPKTMLRDWTQSLSYSDTDIAPGVTNWYFLQAATSPSGHSASVLSVGIPGFRPAVDNSRVIVSFHPAGGTLASNSRAYTVGQPYGEFPAPSYGGKVFLGWYSAVTDGARIDASDIVRRDLTTLFARWADANALRIENLTARQRYPWNGLVDISLKLEGVPFQESATIGLAIASANGGDSIPVNSFVSSAPVNLTNDMYHFVWNATQDTEAMLYQDLVLSATASIDVPSAPAEGTATGIQSEMAIVLSWEKTSGASLYQVWRSATSDFSSAALVAKTAECSWRDVTAQSGCSYHYWIKSVSSAGASVDALELSGMWMPVTYSIHYDFDGGASGTYAPSSATYGSVFRVSAPSRSGYKFFGWSVTNGLDSATAKWGSTSATTTPVESPTTICVNAISGDVYFLNLCSTAESVTLLANWVEEELPGETDIGFYKLLDWSRHSLILVHDKQEGDSWYSDNPVFRFTTGTKKFVRSCIGNYGDTTISPDQRIDMAVLCLDERDSIMSMIESPFPLPNSLPPAYTQSGLTFCIDSLTSLSPGNYTLTAIIDSNDAIGDNSRANNTASYHFAVLPENEIDYQTALDCANMMFIASTNNANPPFGQSWKSMHGGSAVQFGPQNNSETNSLYSLVQGPGILSFNMFPDCESGYDGVIFLTNGVARMMWSGKYDEWQTDSIVIGDGPCLLEWRYVKDVADAGGHDVVYMDGMTWSPILLEQAVDNQTLLFSTGGDADWTAVTAESYSGGSCVRSGAITDNQSTWLQTEVSGAGTLAFRCKASCENNWDKLLFSVDGIQKASITGDGGGWNEYQCDVSGSGSHVVRWEYVKDQSVSSGSDCCWIDSVVWTPAAGPTFTMSGGILTGVRLNGVTGVAMGK